MNSVKILHAVRSAITAIAELLVTFSYCSRNDAADVDDYFKI